MVRLRKEKKQAKATDREFEDDFARYDHTQVASFHPHSFLPLALAEAKRFEEDYAVAHTPVHGEAEEE